jgi:hypothetical protein
MRQPRKMNADHQALVTSTPHAGERPNYVATSAKVIPNRNFEKVRGGSEEEKNTNQTRWRIPGRSKEGFFLQKQSAPVERPNQLDARWNETTDEHR